MALKIIKYLDQNEKTEIREEIEVLRVLGQDEHPGILRLIDAYFEKGTATVVTEFIEGDHLYQWFRTS